MSTTRLRGRNTATAPRKRRLAPDVSYMSLIARYPLLPIRSEVELDAAQSVVAELLLRSSLTPGEQGYLEALGLLIERYEAEAYPMPEVSDATMLRHLVDAKGVTLSKLAKDTGIMVSTLSAILSGKRTLNRTHIEKLAPYFEVEPGVFLRRGLIGH